MPNFKKNTSTFKMYGKSPMAKKLVGKQGKLDKNKDGEISKADFDMMNSKSPLEMYGKKSMAKMYGKSPTRVAGKPTPESKKAKVSGTKSGPDWSKAPKMNTQARRDWYTKNNLAQDKTTKLKSTARDPKTEIKVDPTKGTTTPKKKSQGQKNVEYRQKKKAEFKAKQAKKNIEIAEKRRTRNLSAVYKGSKLSKFVSGLGPRSKAKK